MIYLAYFILGFAAIQLIVAFVNLLFKQTFFKSDENFNGLVSVLVPARNEEKNIANLLNDILKQDYKNIEVIVFNDQSTDRTEEVVLEFLKIDNRIKLINSGGLPEGWLGKNYACHSLSKRAKGGYFLFLDADVRISEKIIINTIAFSEKYKLGLLSIFPKQIMLTISEKVTVPNMNYILLTLLPLILVRKSIRPSLAAANGQFMLFNSAIYNKTMPHEIMKLKKVEDIEIARYYKKSNIPVACLTGDETIKCRMYQTFNEAINGFSKNVSTFFGNSFLLAFFFWAITTFGFIAVFAGLGVGAGILYVCLLLLTRFFISVVSKQGIIMNLVLLIPQQLVLGLFIYKAFLYKFNRKYQWKGRNIPS